MQGNLKERHNVLWWAGANLLPPLEKVKLPFIKYGVDFWSVVLLTAFIILFFLASHYFPMRADDYWYNFVIERSENAGRFTEKRIETWRELWQSMFNHRYVPMMNGRLGNAFCQLTQFIDGGGKRLFCINNVLALVLAVFLMQKYCFKRITVQGTALVLLSGMFFVPSAACLFWMAASYSYLWGLCLFLLYIILLRKACDCSKISAYQTLSGILVAFLAGWWHEALGAALCSATVLLFIARKGKCGRSFVFYCAAVFLGCLIAVTSLGNITRAVQVYPPSLRAMAESAVIGGFYNYFIPVFLIFIALILFKKNPFEDYKKNVLPYLFFPFIALSVTFAPDGGWGGGYFFPCMYLLIVFLVSAKKIELRLNRKQSHVVLALAVLFMLAFTCMAKGLNNTWRKFETLSLQASSDGFGAVVCVLESEDSFFFYTVGMAPMGPGYAMYPYCGPFYGRKKFFVMVNPHPHERKYYDKITWRECKSEPGISYARHKDKLLVRISERAYKPTDGTIVCRSDGNEYFLRPAHQEFRPMYWLRNLLMEPNEKIYASDYLNGCFYYILPGQANCKKVEMNVLEISETKKNHSLRLPVGA